MSDAEPFDLQDAFLRSRGKPVKIADDSVVQADRLTLDGPAVVEIRLTSETERPDDYVILSFKKDGRVSLSDGDSTKVLEVREASGLPRWVRHKVDPKGDSLIVYNAYKVVRGGREFTESWTGNAGMVVEEISASCRRYKCSNGRGAFNKNDLTFELAILPSETAWHPEEIY